jgi:hypothetical protein
MALQGADANGEVIRAKMRAMGVSTDFVRVSADYATSVSHILSGPDGERTILMAPASTSRLNGEAMRREFAEGVAARFVHLLVTNGDVREMVEVSAQLAAVCNKGGGGVASSLVSTDLPVPILPAGSPCLFCCKQACSSEAACASAPPTMNSPKRCTTKATRGRAMDRRGRDGASGSARRSAFETDSSEKSARRSRCPIANCSRITSSELTWSATSAAVRFWSEPA